MEESLLLQQLLLVDKLTVNTRFRAVTDLCGVFFAAVFGLQHLLIKQLTLDGLVAGHILVSLPLG